MDSLLGFLCVLLATVTTVQSLSCVTCASLTTSCSGTIVTCPSGSICGSQHTQGTAAGGTTDVFARFCILESACSLNGSITYTGGTTKIATSCCNIDYCTPTQPTLPTVSSQSNGVTCRTCISTSSTSCYTSDTIQCTGNENMCLRQSTNIKGSQSLATSIRGCATQSICDLGTQTTSEGGTTTTREFICTSGSVALRGSMFLPVILFSVLIKLVS